jgi:hypothetical protein
MEDRMPQLGKIYCDTEIRTSKYYWLFTLQMTVINQKIPVAITVILCVSCHLSRLGSDVYRTNLETVANIISLLHRSTSTIALFHSQARSKELGNELMVPSRLDITLTRTQRLN